jgi:hypothetical protein
MAHINSSNKYVNDDPETFPIYRSMTIPKNDKTSDKPKAPYDIFMSGEMKRLYEIEPNLQPKEYIILIAKEWIRYKWEQNNS